MRTGAGLVFPGDRWRSCGPRCGQVPGHNGDGNPHPGPRRVLGQRLGLVAEVLAAAGEGGPRNFWAGDQAGREADVLTEGLCFE